VVAVDREHLDRVRAARERGDELGGSVMPSTEAGTFIWKVSSTSTW
jgi:hypothetical protein